MRIDGLSWDDKAEDHIARHNVDIDEVEEAVRNIRYAKRSAGYLLLIGQSDAGRFLTVVLDHEGDNFWYPVTARDASSAERKLVGRRAAAKGRK
jgi:uncharacterized DUF497 family protein